MNSPKKTKTKSNDLFISDSEDDFEQNISPTKFKQRKVTSSAILSLTPQKAGIPKFNPADCSFIDWLTSLETTFDWLKSSDVDEAKIIQLIIMSLPTNLAWVGQNLDEESKKKS